MKTLLEMLNFTSINTDLHISREELLMFLRKHAIIRSSDERILSPSGKPIAWLVDMRIALLDPDSAHTIARLMWTHLEQFLPMQLACVEMTGIPLLSSIQAYARSLGHRVNGVIIRKERKGNGRQRLIEGTLDDSPVVLIDDILNSGRSIQRARTALAEIGRSITAVVSVVDFGRPRNHLIFGDLSVFACLQLAELDLAIHVIDDSDSKLTDFLKPAWRFRSGKGNHAYTNPKSSPLLANDKVFFGTDAGIFWALNQSDGSKHWSFSIGTTHQKGIWSSPSFCNSRLFFGGYDGNVYSVDADSGEQVWRFDVADWVGSSPCCVPHLDILFVGLEYAQKGKHGSLIALELHTGKVAWEFRTEQYVHCSPIYISLTNSVIFGDNAGKLYCLSATDGRVIWIQFLDGAVKSKASFDVTREQVLVGSFGGSCYAFDVYSGAPRWTALTRGSIYSTPLLCQNAVIVCSTDKAMYALDPANGNSLTAHQCDAKLFSSPISVGEYVYFASTAGSIYQYSEHRLAITGIHHLPEAIANTLAYSSSRNLFFALCNDGQMFALHNQVQEIDV
jgi:outer membrane protein assembly factor BamB/orotate phosphoribosyltransferase